MTVDELRRFVNFIAKKNQSGANPSPSEFNLALQRSYMEFVTDKYKSWQKDQKNTDDIRFLLTERLFSVPATGKLTLPDGVSVVDISSAICPKYMHVSSLRSVYVKLINGNYEQLEANIDVLRDGELSHRLVSKIIPPTKEYPIATINDSYIQLYPKNLGFVKMSYLKQPTLPLWAFTGGTTTPPVYDSSNSIQMEISEENHNDIAMRILRYLGISIRELPLTQYAQAMKEEGL